MEKREAKEPQDNVVSTPAEHIESAMTNDRGDPISTGEDTTIIRTVWKDNKRFFIIAAIINLANLDYGLDTGMINGFQAMPGFLKIFGYADPSLPGGYGITTTVQQLITSLLSVGMSTSTLVAGPITGHIGRKGGLWLATALIATSITMQMLVTTHGALYASRLIMGWGCGLFLISSQLYMQEVSPAHLRSMNYAIFITWVSIGSFVGSIVNNYCAKIEGRESYRIPLGIIYAATVLFALIIIPLPETPRYLTLKGKKDKAFRSLRWLRDAAYTDIQITEELAEIQRAIEIDLSNKDKAKFLDIFRHGNLRRTITSVALATYTGASGSQFIIQYGVVFFVETGNGSAFKSTIIVFSMGLLGSLVSPLYSGKVGKRLILMIGMGVQAFCMFGTALVGTIRGLDQTATNVILAMTCIYMFTFCATCTPFVWQVAGEIPSQPLRAHTLGLASCIAFASAFLLTFTVPYFINPTALNWGAKYGWIWFVTNLMCLVYTFLYVPETNKRTLEEIDECYLAKVPIRKFPQYKAVGSLQARQEALHGKSVLD